MGTASHAVDCGSSSSSSSSSIAVVLTSLSTFESATCVQCCLLTHMCVC
jgi:hypothetical protein